MVSEALRLSFMDFHLSCTSHLPWILVMGTLARSSQVDASLLLDTLKRNLESFVVQKRASLAKFALQQLKVSILKGSHPVVTSLKKHSGFPDEDPPEHGVSTDDGNCGIAPTYEESDAHTQFGAANVLLKSPALPHENGLLHKYLPIEHLLLAKRNGSGTFKNAEGKFCDEEMTTENGCETCLKRAKKYKHDESTGIEQYSKGHTCPSEKIDYVGCMGKNGLLQIMNVLRQRGLLVTMKFYLESIDDVERYTGAQND